MAVWVQDGIFGNPITDAFFSTTYGGWDNGWYLVQDFQPGQSILVAAPGYYWDAFQGVDGATIGIGLTPQP